jgi:hypothetical protein
VPGKELIHHESALENENKRSRPSPNFRRGVTC